MSIPTFHFLQCTAHRPESSRAFMGAILATNRFWRTEKSQIMFEVSPGDYCLVERKQNLQSILEDGAVLQIAGDVGTCWDILWIWITAAKWKLPRLNPERPWTPEKPLPVRHAGQVRR